MELSKLEITPLDKDGKPLDAKKFSALFNPSSYTITKAVSWSPAGEDKKPPEEATNSKFNAPMLSYGGGTARQLSLELFYDVTETGGDVRSETNKIVKLTIRDRDMQRPPAVSINWGGPPPEDEYVFPFICVVSRLTQKYTMFRSDGTPVRATLTVDFTEFLEPRLDQHKTDPEFTTHHVGAGETLSSISAEVYYDPTLWRVIAEANNLDDPRRLKVGTLLAIPKIV